MRINYCQTQTQLSLTKLGLVDCNIAWKIKNEMNEWKKDASYLTSANLYYFLDKMNYSFTQTDMANPETQYCDSTHLNPFAELFFKYLNPDQA